MSQLIDKTFVDSHEIWMNNWTSTYKIAAILCVAEAKKGVKFEMIMCNSKRCNEKKKLLTLLATLFYSLWFLLTLGSNRRAELGILDFHKMFGFEFKKCSFLVYLTAQIFWFESKKPRCMYINN